MEASRSAIRALLALVLLGLSGIVIAAEPMPQASRSTFLKLMSIQEMMDAENYTQAIAELDELLQKTSGDPYEYALANQYLAHACMQANCPERTRGALETALAQPGLPSRLRANLTMFYGQILLIDEEYELARQNFEIWLDLVVKIEMKPPAGQLFSAAYANYETKNFERANELLTLAVAARPNAPDSWRRLHYQTLFELGRYKEAENMVLDLVADRPDHETYWQLLSNHYLRLEEGRKALSVMSVAYQQQLMTDPTDIRRIISLYSFVDVPERGARLLDNVLDQAILDSDYDTLKQLGNLWLLARERAKAIEVLEMAAEISPDADTDELLASIYFEDERWSEAHKYFAQAIRKGAALDNDQLYLLAGISAARAGDKDAARTHLEKAMKSDEYGSQARSVLRRLDEA